MDLGYYDRDGQPIDLMRFAELHSDKDYVRVAETTVGPYWISTVWLGLDHGFGFGEKPLIFETMVFASEGVKSEFEMLRYPSEEEARRGHEEICTLVRATSTIEGDVEIPTTENSD